MLFMVNALLMDAVVDKNRRNLHRPTVQLCNIEIVIFETEPNKNNNEECILYKYVVRYSFIQRQSTVRIVENDYCIQSKGMQKERVIVCVCVLKLKSQLCDYSNNAMESLWKHVLLWKSIL